MFIGEEAVTNDNQNKPKQQGHDNPKDRGEEVVKVNLTTEKGESQPVFTNTTLTGRLKEALFALLHDFKDIFV